MPADSILMSPEPIGCIVSSVTSMPYMEERGTVSIFQSQHTLDQKLEYLRMLGHQVAPIISGIDKSAFFQQLKNFGVTTITLEPLGMFDSVENFPITDFVQEEMSNESTGNTEPLVNQELDSLLNFLRIKAEVGETDSNLTQKMIDLLKKARFVALVDLPRLRIDNELVFPCLEDYPSMSPIFTSKLMADLYFRDNHLSSTDYELWLLSWEDLQKLVKSNEGSGFILNPNGCELALFRSVEGTWVVPELI